MSSMILSSRLNPSKFIRKLFPIGNQSTRTLLSSNYSCDDQWQKRLEEDDTLKHISTEIYFFELNQKYQQKRPVSAVDIDIFINLLHRPESQVELEHIARRFRQTPRTVDTLESTHHAVCRFYLSNNKLDELLQLLEKRVEFGIFPDVYAYNMILDKCIKSKEWDLGFDCIKLLMLQEEPGNEITKTLVFYVLNKLLVDNRINVAETFAESDQDESSPADDEDDIEYIRVPYLTNPYFDDHFDLQNRNHIFGKSMYFFGRELEKTASNEKDQLLANTSKIMGLIYYRKFEQLDKLLDEKKLQTTNEPFELIKKCLEVTDSNPDVQTQLNGILSKMNENIKVVQGETLSKLIQDRIEKLPKLEPIDMDEMRAMLKQFQVDRVKVLNEQMELAMKQKKREEIEKRQKEFEQKKRLYYFFENFPKHEIAFEEAERRIEEIRSKTIVEEDYVPPERY